MKQIGKKYHKNLAALVIVLAVAGAVTVSHLAGALDAIEFRFYDARVKLFASSSRPSDDIIVVLLDQDSIEWAQQARGWGWPWPRKAYADFIDYMNLSDAKSVTFDVIFSEPSVYLSYRQQESIGIAAENLRAAIGVPTAAGQVAPLVADTIGILNTLLAGEDDSAFADSAERFGRVVQGVFFSRRTGDTFAWPDDLAAPVFAPDNFGDEISRFALDGSATYIGGSASGGTAAQFPIPAIKHAAAVLGSLTGQPDSDHIIRRARLFTLFDGVAVPALGPAALLASGASADITYDARRRAIRWGDFSIPIDDEGKTLLRFRGPLSRYPVYSLSMVLQSAEDYAAGLPPQLPPESFAAAHVLFGFFAPGLFDIFPTPISAVYPGVGVHVTMLDNILTGDFITKAPDWLAVVFILAAVVLAAVLVLYSGRVAASVAGLLAGLLVLVAAVTAAGLAAFTGGWWIPMAAPLAAALLAFLSAVLYSYATEGKDKRFIKHAFSRILSPKVIDQIVADPSQLKLGGERRKMTAMFTDIQRFSSIASELQDQYGADGPKALVNLLNLYLTEMSNIVLGNGGTIDKYEGDAIIAFFGAPMWMENHAALACRSAIHMKKREAELAAAIMNTEGEFFRPLHKLIESGVVRKDRPLYTRLGINSGDMVVGFMGTPAKMDYTIMGNAVNLCARLEGVNKQYGTRGILISEYTRAEIGDEFVVRPLSRLTVVGIPAPLRLYELVDIRSEAAAHTLELAAAWEAAFGEYERRNFDKAHKAFAEICRQDSADTTAEFYQQRCLKFATTPPPETWDGVDNLTEK
ncbi:MAG: adenylate/guanylate cyclase domain-containing protein [Treponema sp.]|nr:adenylate/guanylate cyclase domain-containing protein [Treponema sp.]